MPIPLDSLGSIVDLAHDRRWDANQLQGEVTSRAAALALRRLGRGSVIAIVHGRSANFFADLLAIWHIGGVAVFDGGAGRSAGHGRRLGIGIIP